MSIDQPLCRISQAVSILYIYIGVSKNTGKTPKMDGLFHGKPYFLMDDLGVKNSIFGNTYMVSLSYDDPIQLLPYFSSMPYNPSKADIHGKELR